MYLKRIYDDKLAQASYLIGCPGAGEAVVIDPNRDVEAYMQAAAVEGLRIVAVTETHIHADYTSGSFELAERTGATLYLTDEGDADWKYAFANHPNVVLVKDGDHIRVGALRLDVVHTPGHTPEHITFVLTDESAGSEPCCAFTGDFIFAGDVGRPDLLERAAQFEGTMEKGARVLFDTMQKFRSYPAHLMIWPGHGAGSACGKGLGGVPATTLGYELATNSAFQIASQEEFVEQVLKGQPDPPYYFKEMKRINKAGPPVLGTLAAPPRWSGHKMLDLLTKQEVILDVRSMEEFSAGIIPGTTHIPLDRSFPTWAGWLIPYDRTIYLLANSQKDAETARRDLALIGLDDVRAWFGLDAVTAYREAHGPLEGLPQVDGTTLEQGVGECQTVTLDVRSGSELVDGAIPGSIHIPLGQLDRRIHEVPRGKPVVVYCASGARSPIAAGVLRKHGWEAVSNLYGGYDCLKKRSA